MEGEPPGGGPAEPPVAWLRRLRADRGLSQEQLARLLGVSFATVNRWETGRTQMSGPGTPGPRGTRVGGLPRAAGRASPASRAPSPASGALPRAAGVTAAGPTLPLAQSSFIGRDRELAELIGLLETRGWSP